MVPKAKGVVASGVMYQWFTDVSGLGLAVQARRVMLSDPPKKEEEPAKLVEMWQDTTRTLVQNGASFQDQPFEDVDDRQRQGVYRFVGSGS